MIQLALVVGAAGVMLLLVGLIGGGFTFSGSVMPTVGKLPRVLCFAFGGLLTLLAIGMASADKASTNPSRPTLVADTSSSSTLPPSVTTPAPVIPSAVPAPAPVIPSAVPVSIGTVAVPQGDSSLYVHQAASTTSRVTSELMAGTHVAIRCTMQGEVVTRSDGAASSLWDRIDTGFVPDEWIDTGTDQPTAGPC